MGVFTMDMISYQMGKNSAPQPSGSLSITENGTFDVTEKASAVVNVQGGQSGLPIEIASNCPSPFLLQQSNLSGSVKYIFPTTTASVVKSGGSTIPYIASTGTQYIDTGYVPKTNTKVEMCWKLTRYESSAGAVCGCGWGRNLFFLATLDSSTNTIRWHGKSSDVDVSFPTNTKKTIELYGNTITVDGTTYTISGEGNDNQSQSLQIFAARTSSYYKSSGYIYYVKIYEYNTSTEEFDLIHDFRPNQSEESGHSGEACLYDNVTETYRYNAGSGTFTYGEEQGADDIYVGDNVEILLAHTHSYATFSYQWQKLQSSEYVDISGATSSTYTAQTGDNAIRCILTGTGNSEGTITSSSVTVNEVN